MFVRLAHIRRNFANGRHLTNKTGRSCEFSTAIVSISESASGEYAANR